MLVVVGIIAILIAFLMPALARARRQAQQVACQSNLRQIGLAFHMFANDHQGRLPACQGVGTTTLGPSTEYWKGDWLGNAYDVSGNPSNADTTSFFDSIPQSGTIYPYLGKTGAALRCPGTPQTELNDGGGSNGKFDYQMFNLFSGSRLASIRKQSRPFWSQNGGAGNPKAPGAVTPLVGEFEKGYDPYRQVNPNTPGCNMQGGKMSGAQYRQCIFIGHPAGASMLGVDGSVYPYKRPGASPAITALSWQILSYGPHQSINAIGGQPAYTSLADNKAGWGGFP